MRYLALALTLAPFAFAAEDAKLLDWMNNIAQTQLAERAKAIAAIKTVEQAQQRQIWVKRRINALIGGLPDYNGALRFYDMVSQSDVTLQSSEVKEVRKDEVPLR